MNELTNGVRLGRLPHDPARFAAVRRRLVSAAAPPPASLRREGLTWTPGAYGNQVLPNCSTVALANAVRAWSWTQTGADAVIDPATVPAFYAECVGCADDTAAIEATDGAVLLDVLERADVLGVDFGQQDPIVPDFTAVDPTDRVAMAASLAAGGGLILGLDLLEVDQQGDIWGVGPSAAVTGKPWGGHAALLWSYEGLRDDALTRIATWGTWRPATVAWVLARAVEAYHVTVPQIWLPAA